MKKTFLFVCLALSFRAGTALAQSPDLVIDQPRLASSVELQTATLSTGACATVEGCATAGTRRLLKFDVGFINAGDGDLVLGAPQDHPDLFEFSSCHGHYHLKGAADYQLTSSNGTVLITARKQAFCFRDDTAALAGAGPQKFTCDSQGISPGWEDVYDKSLDCQWLDVTGIPGGDYILRVVCNPDRIFIESNYDNNDATAAVTLPAPPTLPTNGHCKCTCQCKKNCHPKKPWNWNKLSQKFKAQWLKKWDNCCAKDKSGKSKCGCQTKAGPKGKCNCKAKGNCCKPNPKGCACHCHGKGHDNQGDKGDDRDDDDDDHDGKGKEGDHDGD